MSNIFSPKSHQHKSTQSLFIDLKWKPTVRGQYLPSSCQYSKNANKMITDTLLTLFIQHWLSLFIVGLAIRIVRNRFNRGLNKYPGPFLASFTNWWRFYDVYKRRPELTHQNLHAKHGDVVRLGPNYLSFADPKALKTIYGLNKGFVKVF